MTRSTAGRRHHEGAGAGRAGQGVGRYGRRRQPRRRGFTLASLADDSDEPALSPDESGAATAAGPVLPQLTDAAAGGVEVLVGEREVSLTDLAALFEKRAPRFEGA